MRYGNLITCTHHTTIYKKNNSCWDNHLSINVFITQGSLCVLVQVCELAVSRRLCCGCRYYSICVWKIFEFDFEIFISHVWEVIDMNGIIIWSHMQVVHYQINQHVSHTYNILLVPYDRHFMPGLKLMHTNRLMYSVSGGFFTTYISKTNYSHILIAIHE